MRISTPNIILSAFLLAFSLNIFSQSLTTNLQSVQTSLPSMPPGSKGPLDGMDFTWLNGNDRRDSSVFKIPFFSPTILVDVNATHSFNNPIDPPVVGSTALARHDEMEVSAAAIGGDFNYGNARGRIMTQFGTRSTIVPRNDLSVFRGQYDLPDAYRYISEAYAGYHFDKWYGINLDAGLFMSYIGLNSYYQAENWEYQASYTSDNTPLS